MKTETRTLDLAELRAVPADNAPAGGKLTGYAAVFNQDSEPLPAGDRTFIERIKPGAFSNVLGNDVRALVNHDPNQVLGRTGSGTLKIEQDNRGLKVEISPPDTSFARDLMESVKRGDVTQMSFGFRMGPDGDTWTRTGENIIREINQVAELSDVSVVTYPAYPDTTVAARSLDEAIPMDIPEDNTATDMQELEDRQKALEMNI